MLTLTGGMLYVVFFVLCLLGTQGKPSLSFNLPGPFASFATSDNRNAIKVYSGKRVTKDSIRMVYYHDQTVAIVELGAKKLLLNCELIEIFEPEQVIKAVGELQHVTRPVPIKFSEMIGLMEQCKQLEDIVDYKTYDEAAKNYTMSGARGILANNPFTLLSGIIPGTKWCGTGDIARDYYDLGIDSKVDSCCRAHDLCPVKIRAYSKRYNLTNQSLYTKSHCVCDDTLFQCLKQQTNGTPTASIMGNIYFNLVQVPCLEDTKEGAQFRNSRNNF